MFLRRALMMLSMLAAFPHAEAFGQDQTVALECEGQTRSGTIDTINAKPSALREVEQGVRFVLSVSAGGIKHLTDNQLYNMRTCEYQPYQIECGSFRPHVEDGKTVANTAKFDRMTGKAFIISYMMVRDRDDMGFGFIFSGTCKKGTGVALF